MSGDWTAILPESVRGIAKTLLGKEQQSGPLDMLSKAQGLLGGGGNSASGLGGLLGGLTGGNNNQGSGSSVSSVLGQFSGLLGNNGGSSTSGSSSNPLSGLTDKLNGLGSLNSFTGFLSSHNKKQSQWNQRFIFVNLFLYLCLEWNEKNMLFLSLWGLWFSFLVIEHWMIDFY